MRIRNGWWIWTLPALLAMTTAIPARAGDDAPKAGDKAGALIVVRKADGKDATTVRLIEDTDGRWVMEGAEVEMPAAPRPPRRRMHPPIGPQGGDARRPGHDPLQTLLRWLVENETGHETEDSALAAWFGGKNVPLEGLRDAFVADGWDAASLERWMERSPRDPRAARRRGRTAESARGPTSGAWRGPRQARRGNAGRAGRVRTIVLWNDGDGWHRREGRGRQSWGRPARGARRRAPAWGGGRDVGSPPRHRGAPWSCDCADCPGRGGGGGDRGAVGPHGRHQPAAGGAFRGRGRGPGAPHWTTQLPPELRRRIQDAGREGPGAFRFSGTHGADVDVDVERVLHLVPTLVGAIPDFDGDEVDGDEIEQSLRVLGRLLPTLLLEEAPTASGCDGCPKKGSCGDRPPEGSCKGDCENCPSKGTCKGDCKDCPNEDACTSDAQGKPGCSGGCKKAK